MPSKVQCPSCQKTLSVSSRLHGNNLRCPACKSKFLVQIDAMDDLNLNIDDNAAQGNQQQPAASSIDSPYERLAASLLTHGSPQSRSAPASTPISSPYPLSPPSAIPSPYQSQSNWQTTNSSNLGQSPKSTLTGDIDGVATPWFLQIGVLLMVLGILSFILPFLGLQLKILNLFGGGAPLVGMVLGVVGGAMVTVGYGIDEEWTSAFVMGGIPACFFIGFAVVMSQMQPSHTKTRDARKNEFGNLSGRPISQAPDINSPQFPKGSSPNRSPNIGNPTPSRLSSRSNIGSPVDAALANGRNGSSLVISSSAEPTETGFENRPLHRSGDLHSSRPESSSIRPDRATTFGSTPRSVSGLAEKMKSIVESHSFDGESASEQKSNSGVNDWAAKAGNFHDVLSRQVKMEQEFGWSQVRNIPPGMFTKLVGTEATHTATMVHPNSQPMIGLDFALSPSGGEALALMIPVYEAYEKHQIIAKDGYAIAGLNVYANGKILGFQPIFMRVKDNSFSPFDTYDGDWLGTEPEDEELIEKLGGDGRPVFGIRTFGFTALEGLALIIEKANESGD